MDFFRGHPVLIMKRFFAYVDNFRAFSDAFDHCQIHQHPAQNQTRGLMHKMMSNHRGILSYFPPPIIQLISCGLSTSGEILRVSRYQKYAKIYFQTNFL